MVCGLPSRLVVPNQRADETQGRIADGSDAVFISATQAIRNGIPSARHAPLSAPS